MVISFTVELVNPNGLGGNIQNPPTIKVKDSILENPVTLSEYEQYS